MKPLFYILTLATLSCNNPIKQPQTNSPGDTSSQMLGSKEINRSTYYTTKDTLLIVTETGDTLKYSKDEFNKIVDNHHELYSDNVQGPDPTYYCDADKKGFNSEVGQDEYYILYAYFLKQRNGVGVYSKRRNNLICIFSNINSLYQHFQHGGTYFGHQTQRILGYAEFSIYMYKCNAGKLSKAYDIGKQKASYVQSLRELVEDEIQNDNEIPDKQKTLSKEELNGIVNNIEKAISDNFYMRRAQEFQYEHYHVNRHAKVD